MPGTSPALSKCSWLLLRYSGAVFTGRRPSSRAVYQVHGPFIMGGVTPMAIPFLILP